MFTNKGYHRVVAGFIAAFAASACSDTPATAPAPVFDPAGTYESPLSALGGSGTGGVSVTPVAVPAGYFTANIKVRLHGAPPNAVYTVQRAPEVGKPLGHDGSCQRALNISPWTASDMTAASFVTFVQAGTTTPVTFVSGCVTVTVL